MWNVNEIELLICIKFQKRINRNIVECKCLRHSVMNSRKSVLIETLWNVNGFSGRYYWIDNWVLIETLWNVNTVYMCSTSSQDPVLIETLWNVNKYERLGKDLEEYVLIETLWNVNVDTVVFNALRALY